MIDLKDKTLEQLIEDCGDKFQYLTRSGHMTGNKLWFFEAHWRPRVNDKFGSGAIFGSTPREVIEKLWLELRENK